MNGLEFLLSIHFGPGPSAPMAGLMGFELVEVEEGVAVFSIVPTEQH